MEKDELKRLVIQGLSIRQIARRVSRSYTTVRNRLIAFKLKTKRIRRCHKCGESDSLSFSAGRYTTCKKCRNRQRHSGM